MSHTRFTILLIFTGLMLALSFLAFPGAMIGVVAGMGIAILAAMASYAFAGMNMDLADGTLYALMVSALLVLIAAYGAAAWLNWSRGDRDRARGWAAKALICAASPLVALISMQTMMHNWP